MGTWSVTRSLTGKFARRGHFGEYLLRSQARPDRVLGFVGALAECRANARYSALVALRVRRW